MITNIAVGLNREAGKNTVLLVTGQTTTRLSSEIARSVASQLVVNANLIDEQLTNVPTDLSVARAKLQPRLVHLFSGLRRHQVEEAIQLLMDYIDRPEPVCPAHPSEVTA